MIGSLTTLDMRALKTANSQYSRLKAEHFSSVLACNRKSREVVFPARIIRVVKKTIPDSKDIPL